MEEWLSDLQARTIRDHVHTLDARILSDNVTQFLLSTKPSSSPPDIVKSVKGRLQTILRPVLKVDYRRNFRLTSVGDASIEVAENYVSNQLAHHRSSFATDATKFELLQYEDRSVELSDTINSAHGQYLLALHIVLVHAERFRISDLKFLGTTKDSILRHAAENQHRISRLAILPDHVHFTLGVGYSQSAFEIVLAYLNHVAAAHGGLKLWTDSFYVGTIGPYDMGAVRNGVGVNRS
jgi:REP element-mobilizing transposase RayT